MKKKQLFSRLYYHQMNRLLYEIQLLRELNHPGEKGIETEEILRGFFKDIFPQRWGVSTGYAINRNDISTQLDIMIYDKDNYPRIYKGYHFEILPIMALHKSIEVKMQLTTTNLKESNKKSAKIKKMYFGDMNVISAKSDLDENQFYTSLFAFESNCKLENIRKHLLAQEVDGLDLLFVMNEGILIKDKETYAVIPHKSMAWTGTTFDGFEVTKNHKLMVMYITYILDRMKKNKIIDTNYQSWQMHDSIFEDVFEN
ncbi:MAG: hypothetical protein GY714_21580 [Desulfobacterales bacterium]|nr:hypothetical protein [Desulfobacterales bacterium]